MMQVVNYEDRSKWNGMTISELFQKTTKDFRFFDLGTNLFTGF